MGRESMRMKKEHIWGGRQTKNGGGEYKRIPEDTRTETDKRKGHYNRRLEKKDGRKVSEDGKNEKAGRDAKEKTR